MRGGKQFQKRQKLYTLVFSHLISRNLRLPMKATRNQNVFEYSQQRQRIIEQLNLNLSNSILRRNRVLNTFLMLARQMKCRKCQVMSTTQRSRRTLQSLFLCCSQSVLFHQPHKTIVPKWLKFPLQSRHRTLFTL